MSKIFNSPTTETHVTNTPMSLGIKALPSSQETYFLGIDGGGTKTHVVITDAQCRVVGEGFGGASNPLRVGLEEAVSHIGQAVAEACAQARVKLQQMSSACAAIAGVNHPIHYHTMKDALDQALGLGVLELVTDARAALEGALDGHAGVVLIAGTGSIAMGMNDAGEQARSGGWGPTISDEGSGYDIARRALKAVISSFDGRSPRTTLSERILDKLRISSAADLPGVIYNSDSEAVEIASLAEVVAAAARDGDEVARGILAGAGRELGELVLSVVRRLGLQSRPFRVACVGSVFKSGELVLAALREAVLREAPAAEIGPPLYPPTIGAVKLARKRCEMADVRC
ncbi:MAG TPA: BadF/BadG/BcrA/BcrD ATPase family protein [Blastocatellia bacterium]|nr:BadF/BadG/BcrA/BcrD ATPase family protein [Blastocatellia bacterium]